MGSFKPHQSGRYLKPLPDTVWPAPDDYDIEYTLRYGTAAEIAGVAHAERFYIASILAAYARLLTQPSAAKQLPGLRAAMRNGEQNE